MSVKKARGPLQNVIKVTEDLKRQFDGLLQETLEKDVLEPQIRKDIYERCIRVQNGIQKNREALQRLKKSDEPGPVGSYDQRKEDEDRKLVQLSNKLHNLAKTLAHEKEDVKQTSGDEEESAEEEYEEEDDEEEVQDEEEEEEEEEDDDDDDDELDVTAKHFITLGDFQAQQQDDLTFQKGEVLQILDKKLDGWWLAQNSKGVHGLVPKTYLQVYKEASQSPGASEEEETEDEEKESAENRVVRTNSFNRPAEDTISQMSTSKKTQEMSASEALATMGTIPSGFRTSTLSQLLENGDQYKAGRFLQPVLTSSQLGFTDLVWDSGRRGIMPLPARVSMCLRLWICKMIPVPGPSIQILSRHVRLCLFDGSKVLSNIHTVRASWLPRSSRTWTFSPRVTGILPSLLDGDCFVRSGSQSPEIGVLFEVGVTYIRNSTGERGELSCGWTFLKLFDVNGIPLPTRTYELTLLGGTPYERGVEVDPSISRQTTSGVFHQMMIQRRQPRLLVKIRSLNKRRREMFNLLPETLVGSVCHVPLLVFYRQLLGDVLHKERKGLQSTDLICNPVLATFPRLMEQPDVMDALRSGWAEKENSLRRPEKRDVEFMKKTFIQVYHDTAYPLLESTFLQAPRWAEDETEAARWKAIADFLKQNREKEGSIHFLLSPDSLHKPFDISEISYDFPEAARTSLVTL